MGEFEDYLFARLSDAIGSLQYSPFAVGMDIYFVVDDLRRPAVRLVTRTLEDAKACLPKNDEPWVDDASEFLEALWSNASADWGWKLEATVGNEYCSFEGEYYDTEGIALRKKWVQSLKLWYDDQFHDSDFEAALKLGSQIHIHFDELCLAVARKLHPVIVHKFGTDLPIIFFNRESPDHESMGLTFLANPSHLLAGYALYIRDSCGEGWAEFLEQKVEKDSLTYSSLLAGWRESYGR